MILFLDLRMIPSIIMTIEMKNDILKTIQEYLTKNVATKYHQNEYSKIALKS